jgi:hypothetical protein
MGHPRIRNPESQISKVRIRKARLRILLLLIFFLFPSGVGRFLDSDLVILSGRTRTSLTTEGTEAGRGGQKITLGGGAKFRFLE